MEAEFQGLKLRQEGPLGKLLGDPMAGESSAALEQLGDHGGWSYASYPSCSPGARRLS